MTSVVLGIQSKCKGKGNSEQQLCVYGTTRRELYESTDRETSTVTRGKEQTRLRRRSYSKLKNGNTEKADIIVARRSPKSFFGYVTNTHYNALELITLSYLLDILSASL